jgi:hypothetical protein
MINLSFRETTFQEIQRLSSLRDSLLPKLMRGEVRVTVN